MAERHDSTPAPSAAGLTAISHAEMRSALTSEIVSDPLGVTLDEAVICFRHFRAVPRSRQLLADGQPIELGSRAFDLLIALIEARGTVVSKEEIMDRVWPSTVVGESNLRVQMTALRKVLGKDRDVIKTIPGRGYFFAVETEPGSDVVQSLSDRCHETLTLSFDPSAHGSSGPAVEAVSEDPAPFVVVVDDDPNICEALEGLLRSVGLRVEAFGSVEEFLFKEWAVRPVCMILDVWLPGRSGLNFHAELAKANIQVPVIFMSGHADVQMSVQAMKAGAIEFLTKPVRHQELLSAIELAMRPASSARLRISDAH